MTSTESTAKVFHIPLFIGMFWVCNNQIVSQKLDDFNENWVAAAILQCKEHFLGKNVQQST